MRRVAVWAFVLMITASRSHADETSHVRVVSENLQAVLTEAALESPTLLSLVNRIRASNVIAHVTCERFNSFTVKGRTLFVRATRDVRYVRVQVDCLRPHPELVAIIAHELQHVAEIAAAPDVVDQRSFVRLLHTIGLSKGGTREDSYETEAAILTEERVSQEVSSRHQEAISLNKGSVIQTPAAAGSNRRLTAP